VCRLLYTEHKAVDPPVGLDADKALDTIACELAAAHRKYGEGLARDEPLELSEGHRGIHRKTANNSRLGA
jgi:hypothetical protein